MPLCRDTIILPCASQWTNETRFEDNTVNPDQFIGVVLMNSDVVGLPGLSCKNNTPAAVVKKGSANTPC